MSATRTTAHQHSLVLKTLMEQLNPKDPLILLAKQIPWDELHENFAGFYSEIGRPAKDTRLMIGLLILKQLENLSDERLVVEWCRNPYFQAFCGMMHFQWQLPCDPSDISRFRKRIGEKGCEQIFKVSVQLHKDRAEEKARKAVEEKKNPGIPFASEVIVDSTAQEKNIAYPTDSGLYRKVIKAVRSIGKKEKVSFRQTYAMEEKKLLRNIRFNRGKSSVKARRSISRLHTIAGILLRELKRNLDEQSAQKYQEILEACDKIYSQRKGETDRVYSLHEPQVVCLTKGKAGKRHEYGSKASVCIDKATCVILGLASFSAATHDSKTLESTLSSTFRMTGHAPDVAFCDRGYRGVEKVGSTAIRIPEPPKPTDSETVRKKAREDFGRRSAVEPVIGHLKNDFRMAKNYLKGAVGDAINLLMAAAAFNFRKWMTARPSILAFCVRMLSDVLFGRFMAERLRYAV